MFPSKLSQQVPNETPCKKPSQGKKKHRQQGAAKAESYNKTAMVSQNHPPPAALPAIHPRANLVSYSLLPAFGLSGQQCFAQLRFFRANIDLCLD